MTAKELVEQVANTDGIKIVVAKKKKKGGYTVYPQVIEAKLTYAPMIGDCYAIVYEE
jgi:hypothetical protein